MHNKQTRIFTVQKCSAPIQKQESHISSRTDNLPRKPPLLSSLTVARAHSSNRSHAGAHRKGRGTGGKRERGARERPTWPCLSGKALTPCARQSAAVVILRWEHTEPLAPRPSLPAASRYSQANASLNTRWASPSDGGQRGRALG